MGVSIIKFFSNRLNFLIRIVLMINKNHSILSIYSILIKNIDQGRGICDSRYKETFLSFKFFDLMIHFSFNIDEIYSLIISLKYLFTFKIFFEVFRDIFFGRKFSVNYNNIGSFN